MKLISCIFLLFFFLTSCDYQKADKTAPSINSLKTGENFRINLPENHTSGYMWQINPYFDDNILDYYGSVFRGHEDGVDFNFRTLNKGKDTLNFILIKYKDTSDVKQFIIEIK